MHLVEINSSNWEEVVSLTTNENGIPTLHEPFLASNAYSILQSQFQSGWNVRGIEEGGRMIGFTMYGFNEEEHFYEICRLMIDRRYQGKGFGRKALRLIIGEMKKLSGEIYISAEPENKRALHLYQSEGFSDTGTLLEGEKLLKLSESSKKAAEF